MVAVQDYETVELLGKGGFGEVYKSFDKTSGVYVAIKKMRLLSNDAKLQSESEILMNCNSPFIVRYNGMIQSENELWSGLLNGWINAKDIKPDNLFISENGVIKLGDFGLAVQLNHSCSRRNTSCGTSWYMAPEVYDGKSELRSDVWALGISLIELAEGKNPFADCSSFVVMKAVCLGDAPSLTSSKWSAEFVDFVSKCLTKDVEERWSVSQLMSHPFVRDSVERIRTAGKSSLLVKLTDGDGIGVVTQDIPFSTVNMVPDTVIGGKPAIEPELSSGTVVVKCDDDFLSLDEDVEVIEARNGVCNNEAFEEWEMNEYVMLRELIVGDECFQFVKDLRIVGLNELEKVEIGKQCFCKASDGVFEMKDCAKLKSVRIGDGSFVGVVSVVFENLSIIDSIALGKEVFGGKLKLVMKNLGELNELTGAMCALKSVEEAELMGMAKLKKCVLMGGLKSVRSVKMENAGKLESELIVLDLSRFVFLRELRVGDECFENVNEVKLMGLKKLEKVVIGKNCFTRYKNGSGLNPNRRFSLMDCEMLTELKIGCYSFSDYYTCKIENVPSLEVIEMGALNESSSVFFYASLQLKNMPKLKTLLLGDYAFCACHRVVLENLPELTTIQLGGFAMCFKDGDEASELIMHSDCEERK
ncbi:hypothetical protein BLSTO_03721 [Blastocystis sp. subtype 1]